MKVTTDGCLFGAWAATIFNQQLTSTNRLLDIGAGTGLLSLMLAQATRANIDAVEIETAAAMQAEANFAASPWATRLQVYHTAIQAYSTANSHQYDCIITNPPFFEHDLKSTDAKRNMALHNTTLSLDILLATIQRLLASTGKFAILLPYNRLSYFIKLATQFGFVLHEQVFVKQTPKHPYFRAMLLFGYTKKITVEKELIIKEGTAYTAAFKMLLTNYYLHL
jgi:tRNA1Val (adenine37-N6)-methyltransferase